MSAERAISRGVFVAGTDTEVGKTFVSAALVAGLRARGVEAGYLKPVSTDGQEQDGRLVSPDALWVGRVCGLADAYHRLNPICLAHALSPLAAARLEGVELAWPELVRRVRDSLAGQRFWVCEGVGGVLVPLCPGRTALDLMAELDLPVVVAARPGLGTINHTLLTIEALRARDLAVVGFVFSGQEEGPASQSSQASNSRLIEEFSGARFLGALPWLDEPGARSLARAAGDCLDLEPLLALDR